MKKARIYEIGGIRGWVAVIVFIFHAFLLAHDHPLHKAFDGPFMVLLIFALSGDALSVSFTRQMNAAVPPTVPLKRVLRLSGVAVVSLLLTYVAISNSFLKSSEAGMIAKIKTLQILIPSNLPDLSLSSDVFYTGFIKMYQAEPRLNPFLWTIRVEFSGSFLVFAIGSVYPRLRFRPVILGLAIWFYFYYQRHMTLFIFGIFLGFCRTEGIFAFCHRSIALRVLFGLLVVLLPFMHTYSDLPSGPGRDYPPAIVIGSACCYLFCLYASKEAVWFFSTRLSYFLGEISFPFYAVSGLLICTFQSQLIILLTSGGSDVKATEWTLLCTAATCMVLIFLSSVLRFIEMGYLRVLDKVFDCFVDPASKHLESQAATIEHPPYQAIPEPEEVVDTEVGIAVRTSQDDMHFD